MIRSASRQRKPHADCEREGGASHPRPSLVTDRVTDQSNGPKIGRLPMVVLSMGCGERGRN
jgi:hypothetical protein